MLTAATLRHQEAARVWALRDQIIDARYELSLTHCVKQEAQDKQDAESRDLRDQIAMLERLADAVEERTPEVYASVSSAEWFITEFDRAVGISLPWLNYSKFSTSWTR